MPDESCELSAAVPERVLGVHLTYLPTPVPPGVDADELTDEERARVERMRRYLAQPAGYWQMQSTRPQTLAYALTDSPVGQLAWIADKVAEWTDPACPVSDDKLLTTVSLYWLTRTAGSSSRLYYEAATARKKPLECPVPLGVAVSPHDLVLPVRRFAERRYDIVHWTEFDCGGHFPILEVPDLYVEDVRGFFRRFR